MSIELDEWQNLHENWDIAYVGTSPVTVLNAIYQSLNGKKVVVLEKGDKVGGAWAKDTACGIDGVDIGCHNICLKELDAQFLTKAFGIEFIEVRAHEYLPRGGCARMSERLVDIAQKCGVVLKLRCELDKAILEEAGCLLECTSYGDPIEMRAKTVVKPSCTAFKVFRKNERISKQILTSTKRHYYLIIKDESCPTDYFLKNISLADIGFKRISNLTQFVPLEDPSHRMFVVERDILNPGFEESPAGMRIICQRIEKYLKKEGYLSGSAELVQHDARSFMYQSVVVDLTDEEAQTKLQRLDTTLISSIKNCRSAYEESGDKLFAKLKMCTSDAVDLPSETESQASSSESPVSSEASAA